MESLKLKRIARKLRIAEDKKINSRFNFGKDRHGNITTSTSNGKAHTYNKLIRKSNQERDENFQKMLKAYENGEVTTKSKKAKHLKGYSRTMYLQSIAKANNIRNYIKDICGVIVEDIDNDINVIKIKNRPIYLWESK